MKQLELFAFLYNDGGRAAARYKGKTGDCVNSRHRYCRRQAVCGGVRHPAGLASDYVDQREDRVSDRIAFDACSPRDYVYRKVYEPYLRRLGWAWTPTMRIGSGCKVHLSSKELPPGRLIVSVSGQFVAVIDGVIHDIHDCSCGGARCVYGYYQVRS
jgi:hypothetical protein